MADEPKLNPPDDTGQPIECRDCYWYRGTVLAGVCHGAPPTTVITGATQAVGGPVVPQLGSYWPGVDGSKFCGAFKREAGKEWDPLPGVS